MWFNYVYKRNNLLYNKKGKTMKRKMFFGLLLLVGALTGAGTLNAQVQQTRQTLWGAKSGGPDCPCYGKTTRICAIIVTEVKSEYTVGSLSAYDCNVLMSRPDGEVISDEDVTYVVPEGMTLLEYQVQLNQEKGLVSIPVGGSAPSGGMETARP